MTDRQVARAQEMRDTGMSYRAIGRALSVSNNAVTRWLNPVYKERQAALGAAYRATHREEAKKATAAYRAMYPERVKVAQAAYCITHREEAKAQSVAWRNNNKDRYIANYRAYAATHREEDRASSVAWRRKHPDKVNAQSAAKRALKAGALIGITGSQLAEIAEIYRRAKEDPKVRCYLCGELIPMGHRHVDHIYPASKGGEYRPSNLAVACDHCNESKHDKLPYEAGVLI